MGADLFDGAFSKSRQAPRVLMHVCDAGPSALDDTFDEVRFSCARCGYETDWEFRRRREAKRGVPCPKCNEVKP